MDVDFDVSLAKSKQNISYDNTDFDYDLFLLYVDHFR